MRRSLAPSIRADSITESGRFSREIAQQNQIEHIDQGRPDHCPQAIDQPQAAYQHKAGYEARAKDKGNHDEEHDELPPRQIPPRERVGRCRRNTEG